eukprot:3595536-Pleurochrysis_carterae.AAC.1
MNLQVRVRTCLRLCGMLANKCVLMRACGRVAKKSRKSSIANVFTSGLRTKCVLMRASGCVRMRMLANA